MTSVRDNRDYTTKIQKIGAAMQVHKVLGNGFQRVIYQRALEIELQLYGLNFKREVEMPVWYRNRQIGTRRVDFLAEAVILVEWKALNQPEDVPLVACRH